MRPDFSRIWGSDNAPFTPIEASDYAAGWVFRTGAPPRRVNFDYFQNLSDQRAVWLGEQMLNAVGHEWQSDVTYDAYAVVRSPVNGQLYRSLVGSNIGNEPSVSGSKWALGVQPLSTDFLNTTRINVASAATVNLTSSAPNTRHINITGTTTITAFTVAAGQAYFVRFAGSLTLTNNASIVTQTGANITTAAGDTCIIRATAANVVEVLCYVAGAVTGTGSTVLSASPALTGTPTAPTAAQFDNDTSIATTEFVQRALGNYQGQFSATSTQTLSPAVAGMIINAGNTITLTLPLGTSVTVGATYQINNSGVGAVTVQAAAGNNLYAIGNGTLRSFVLNSGDSITVAYVGGNQWYAWGGVQLGLSASFGSSLAANGYQKLPSGLIIQWGTTSVIGDGLAILVTLPLAFPSSALWASASNSVDVSADAGAARTAGAQVVSASQIRVSQNSTNGSTNAVSWFAIGF